MSAPSELSEPAAALYRGELSAFVEARNRLATELRGRGDKSLAAAVKALAKPSVSAWAVDQLYWREGPRFAAFLAAAASVRDGLRGGAGPTERHVAAREHRDAHADLLARAQTILGDAGHGNAPALLRRIGTTLEAIATRGWPEPGPGMLAADLDPPGFEDTFALDRDAPVAKRSAVPEPESEPEVEPEVEVDRKTAKAREAEARLREAAAKRAAAHAAAVAAAREDATTTARELDARRRDCDEAEARERETADAHETLVAQLTQLQRKVERAATSVATARAAADGCRERRERAAKEHERAAAKLRELQEDA